MFRVPAYNGAFPAVDIVYFLIDTLRSVVQEKLITALGELKKQTGQEVYFLHVSVPPIANSYSVS